MSLILNYVEVNTDDGEEADLDFYVCDTCEKRFISCETCQDDDDNCKVCGSFNKKYYPRVDRCDDCQHEYCKHCEGTALYNYIYDNDEMDRIIKENENNDDFNLTEYLDKSEIVAVVCDWCLD